MDDPEYRAVPRDEQFRRVLDYGFRPGRGPEDLGDYETLPDRLVGEARGLVADGDLRAICAHVPLRVRLRGGFRDVGGLAGVATRPEHRREGLVGRLLRESLAEYRERGWPVSVLWTGEYGLYGQYGWAVGGRLARVACPTEQFAPAQSAAAGEFRRVTAEEWETLAAVRRAADRGAQLAVRRSEEYWRKRLFRSWGTDPYAYVWERDGEVRGYLLYTLESGDGATMELVDHAAVDHEALLNLLRFCHNHASQADRVAFYDRPDTDAFDLVEDPRTVDCELRAGAMVRLADVPAALGALDYPADGSLALGVTDRFAGWNDATFRVAVADGTATVDRVDADADATVDVDTLSQIVVGYHSVEAAARLGSLEADEDARATLDALFPPRRVHFADTF